MNDKIPVAQVIVDIEDAYVRWSDEVFCRGTGPVECPCAEVSKSLWTSAGWKEDEVFRDRMFNGTAKKLEQCISSKSKLGNLETVGALTLLRDLETNYQCSGVCDRLPFLMFDDVRK